MRRPLALSSEDRKSSHLYCLRANTRPMVSPIRVVQYGLGPIGLACAASVLNKASTGLVKLVGAIDIDPAKAGKDLSELLECDNLSGITVSADAAAVLARSGPHVVLHTTSSFLLHMADQLIECVAAGANVISSTEELSFPYDRHPELSRSLDEAARDHFVTILGTGVNPGYAMDVLALFATGACTDVRSVWVERVVDASHRRGPLQRKIGAGLTIEEVKARKAGGIFGHIGLRESLLMVADGLGWRLDDIGETLEVILAGEPVETPHVKVRTGSPAGIHQRTVGFQNAVPVLTLDLKMYVGAQDSVDRIHVDGTPPLDLVIRGGIFGDTATVAALINAIPSVIKAAPGLTTMHRLPVPMAFAVNR